MREALGWILLLPAIIYQLLAICAAIGHLRRRKRKAVHYSFQPPISVLKPLRGLDPNTYEAFVSQVEQNYPSFELLFGARDEDDPAVAEVKRLQARFPSTDIRLIIGSAEAANAKVGTLMRLAEHARYPVWVVNDSDIKVTPDYLSEVAAPLANSAVSVVTCPYRVKAHNFPAAWESLGIATDFMPSTLVAQLVGVREFGLGSTLAFRSADLKAAGGFAALAEYLADDYQLARQLTERGGGRALLSTYTVETALAGSTWSGIWQHQVRWARTIRASRGGGYAGLFITHAGVWILFAIWGGYWVPLWMLIVARIVSALLTGGVVLRSPLAAALCWLSPVWDLYAFCVWVTSYAGRQVRWRDRVLRIDSQGRIMRP